MKIISMTKRLQVKWIVKTVEPGEKRITHICGRTKTPIVDHKDLWRISAEEAIEHIRNGTYAFYVHEEGNEVDVLVVSGEPHKKDCLRTTADKISKNNLENLDEWAPIIDKMQGAIHHLPLN